MRKGIVLVGDTYSGKSCAIKALKGLLNDKLLPLFEEFYTARNEEKIKSDEQARKSKDTETSVKMFKAYLNDVYKSVTAKGLVDVKTINPKTLTVEEL